MNYKKLNTITGWLVFLIATIVYFLTVEDTASLWDCGEYITVAYKLEVGHPPGAPLFMMLGRIFSLFAVDVEHVAIWINRMSALSSSGTILFMFWSITMFAKKIALKDKRTLTKGEIIAILGSGAVGALAYTFTESLWFSAVEGEVYAMSSLFTAVIFWAVMKWDEEMDAIKHGELENNQLPMRWMVFILFMIGLAIGVHLLGLLVVPTLAYAIYFNYNDKLTIKGFLLTGLLSVVVLGVIQEGVIPGIVSFASKFEIAFVNTFGLPFYSGTIFFFVVLIAGIVFLLNWSKKKQKSILYLATIGMTVFLIGYGSFAAIVIRSNANTPLDENDPENLATLHAYLKREQYGSAPLLYGPYWNSIMDKTGDKWGDRSKSYARRYVVVRGEQDLKAFKHEDLAREYAKNLGNRYEVVEKYFVTNESARIKAVPAYEQNTFFPRMYWSDDQQRIDKYKYWSGYDGANDDFSTEKGNDGMRLPTFSENITYFVSYQMNWMYWRYFMWNFAGRQNDIQGHGDEMRGNWLSGVDFIDEMRLGAQGTDAPFFTNENPSYNRFFLLPLIFGFIGLIFHFYRAPKDAILILFTFIMTGLAIVVYLNQKPIEPRERDYAYAASFYAFAMWIGLSVYALFEAYKKMAKRHWILFGKVAGYGLAVFLVVSIASQDFSSLMYWIYMSVVAALALGIFGFIGAKAKGEVAGATLATVLVFIVPVILACQGWDDHDRSGKTTAKDLAYNYLESCGKNGIIFTNGDNDTFPLWYLQEVEGKRTDIRVCNLSLMGTDWYTDQMKLKAYDSEPLPIKFREDQIMMYEGSTDQVYFMSMLDMLGSKVPEASMEKVFLSKRNANKVEFERSYARLKAVITASTEQMTAKSGAATNKVNELKNSFAAEGAAVSYKSLATTVNLIFEIFGEVRNGNLEAKDDVLKQFQEVITSWENDWDYMPIAAAMEFTRDDKNIVMNNGRKVRMFPSKGFILPVNIDNAIKSGVLAAKDRNDAAKEIKFQVNKQYLMRDQVMLMDILANNDWKRPIYFSSNYGSDVSIALFMAGHVKQVGIAYELTPLKSNEPFDKDKMYDNLMNKYQFGKMNQKEVLTDYYARRHTNQYKSAFTSLVDSYSREIDQKEQLKKQFVPSQLELMRNAGMNKVADSITKVLAASDADIAALRAKIIAVSKRSIEVMPPNTVLDYGEIDPSRETITDRDGVQYQVYIDGNLHKYVGFLMKAGAVKDANSLGLTTAKQLESIINYFDKSDVKFAMKNTNDLTTALYNYFLLALLADEDPNGPLAKHVNQKVEYYMNKMFPRMYADINNLSASANDNNRAYYQRMLRELKGNIEAVCIEFGFIETNSKVPGQGALTQEELQKMLDQQK